LLVLMLSALESIQAQQSGSYKLSEHTFNAGGRPESGVVAASVSFRVSLDSIGDAVAGTVLSSGSFRAAGGFYSAFPPPSEVESLFWVNADTLRWSAEPSAGAYNLYRADLVTLPGLTYGDCLQSGLTGTITSDTDTPAAAGGFFYLVTVENRLGEEGTKGIASDNTDRPNPAPCP